MVPTIGNPLLSLSSGVFAYLEREAGELSQLQPGERTIPKEFFRLHPETTVGSEATNQGFNKTCKNRLFYRAIKNIFNK